MFGLNKDNMQGQVNELVERLKTRRLIRLVEIETGETSYTAHPLIRAHYAARLVKGPKLYGKAAV